MEVCDLRFDIEIAVEEAGTKRSVLWHHHQRDDFFALDYVKFEAMVFLNYLFPLLSVCIAHFGGRHEKGACPGMPLPSSPIKRP